MKHHTEPTTKADRRAKRNRPKMRVHGASVKKLARLITSRSRSKPAQR